MPEGKKTAVPAPKPVREEDLYSAKTHLHQPVPVQETATVSATAQLADAPEGALPSEVRPEIVTWEKLCEQRSLPNTNIVALEIDEAAARQAKENIVRSPWKKQIEVVQADFRKYQSPEKFDVIVSNPPYFVDSLGCPDQQRNSARHNDSLTYEELLEGVTGLLTENGTFTIVIPMDVADRVKMIASEKKLQAVRQLNVITKPGGIPKRTLITFSFSNQECIVEELLTEVARHQYSKEYIALTREYYLNM